MLGILPFLKDRERDIPSFRKVSNQRIADIDVCCDYRLAEGLMVFIVMIWEMGDSGTWWQPGLHWATQPAESGETAAALPASNSRPGGNFRTIIFPHWAGWVRWWPDRTVDWCSVNTDHFWHPQCRPVQSACVGAGLLPADRSLQWRPERARRAPALLGCTGLETVPGRKHNAHLSDTLSSQTARGEISAWQVTNYGEHTGAEATIGKELLYIILSAKLW